MNKAKATDVDDNKYLNIGKIAGFDIFSGGKTRVLSVLTKFIAYNRGFWYVATVNPEFVMMAKNDKKFRKILESTALNTTDGIGLVWADQVYKFSIFNFQFSKCLVGRLMGGLVIGVEILRGRYRDKIAAGSELMVEICKSAVINDWPVFFLGGFGDGARLTGERIDSMIGGGLKYETCGGRPDFSDAQVLLMIQRSRIKVLFVAYGMKKQEEWIYENRKALEKTGVRLAMGVGRSFDYYSGKVKMAPGWVKKMGLEWLYSLIKDPKRLKRQLALPKFVWEVLTNN